MKAFKIIIILLVLYVGLYEGLWNFGFCRVWVGPDEMLIVTQKLWGKVDKTGSGLVQEGYQGIWERTFLCGRYFFNPLLYDIEKVPLLKIDINVKSNSREVGCQIGVVTAKVGDDAKGEFIVERGQKGIWKEVLTPGWYGMNPRGYQITLNDMINIRTGNVGCVTALFGKEIPEDQKGKRFAQSGEQGLQRYVLNPGFYALNPQAYQVTGVEVGFNLFNQERVKFPSSDGFDIYIDTTVVWGLHPKNVPHIMLEYGDFDQVEKKIINPQVSSISRLEGSILRCKQFIEGESREKFQEAFTEKVIEVCQAKNVDVFICLVRGIEIPQNIKVPIQAAYLNEELKLTKDSQSETAKVEGELQELRSDVDKGKKEVTAETEKIVKMISTNGEKIVRIIAAEADVKIKEIEKEIAKLDAQINLILGQANATKTELIEKAKADRFVQQVKAFGGAEAYTRYTFAQNLPDDMKIDLRYTGQGTFWTDMGANGNRERRVTSPAPKAVNDYSSQTTSQKRKLNEQATMKILEELMQ